MTQLPPSQTPDHTAGPLRHLPIFAAGLGLFAGVFCTAAVLSQPLGMALDRLSLSAGNDDALAQAFGIKTALGAGAAAVKVLDGINGVAAAPGAGQTLAPEVVADPTPNIAPAAWDSLSNGGCMTVTTKSGASFSFRILGVHPSTSPKTGHEPPKVDLAITTCPEAGESIVKAVIEPYGGPSKAVVPERSL
jgi:hypothetical protein